MTAHLHTEHVEGCYRCELSKDEMTASDPLSLRDVIDKAVTDQDPGSWNWDGASPEARRLMLRHLADAVLAALREHPDALAAELGWTSPAALPQPGVRTMCLLDHEHTADCPPEPTTGDR